MARCGGHLQRWPHRQQALRGSCGDGYIATLSPERGAFLCTLCQEPLKWFFFFPTTVVGPETCSGPPAFPLPWLLDPRVSVLNFPTRFAAFCDRDFVLVTALAVLRLTCPVTTANHCWLRGGHVGVGIEFTIDLRATHVGSTPQPLGTAVAGTTPFYPAVSCVGVCCCCDDH